MGKFKRLLTWAWLLNKRLFRKPTFLAILLLIPVLVFGYGLGAQGESGMVTIVLAQEGEDPLSAQVIEDLLGSSKLILFQQCDSAQEAEDRVAHGKADAAWIFPEDMDSRIEAFTEDPDPDNAFIRVIQREEKVMLMLTREVLGGKVMDLCTERIYIHYIRANLPQMDTLSDEDLLELYETTSLSGDLFSFEQTDGSVVEEDGAGYLLTPVRGLLAVVIVLCAMATAMYYVHDSKAGTFAWMSEGMRPLAELGCQMVSVLDLSVAALLSLLAIRMAGELLWELLVLVLYSLCAAAFGMMLRRLCGSIRALGALLPLLVVAMLLICPVFFDLGALRSLQYLLPPTYYINAVYNSDYVLYMLAYIAGCGAVYFLSGKLLKRD